MNCKIMTLQCSELFFHVKYMEQHTILASTIVFKEGSNFHSHGRRCQKPELYEGIKQLRGTFF